MRRSLCIALAGVGLGTAFVGCSWSLEGFSGGVRDSGSPETETGIEDGGPDTGEGAPSGPSCGGRPGIGSSMVHVLDAGFCIDATETTLDDYRTFLAADFPFPPECSWKTEYTTTSRTGTAAIGDVDWCDAFSYCKWAGKRLCGGIGGTVLNREDARTLRSEWHYACVRGGNPLYTWPYGSSANAAICLYQDSPNSGQSRPVASNDRCVGPEGVFDLSGNVWEWENACDPAPGPNVQCNLRGGGFLRASSDWGSCAAVPDAWNRNSHVDDTGIRCCSDFR